MSARADVCLDVRWCVQAMHDTHTHTHGGCVEPEPQPQAHCHGGSLFYARWNVPGAQCRAHASRAPQPRHMSTPAPRAVRWPRAPQLFYDGDGSGEQEWVDLSGLMHQPPPSEPFAMRVVASLTPGSHATRQRYAALVRAEQLLCFCRRPERPGETVVRCGRRASPRQACCSPWCDAVCATRV